MVHPKPHATVSADLVLLVLLVLGGIVLLTRLFDPGSWILLSSALLSAAGLLRRNSGWFIPGGVLAGTGLGAFFANTSPLAPTLSEGAAGGLFLLSLTLGWVSVAVLSSRFGDRTHAWVLLPTLTLTLIGGLLLSAGGETRILEVLAYAWPLALVAVGAHVLMWEVQR